MDYIVHGVTKSRMRLSDFHFTALLGFPVAQLVKNRPAREGTLVQSWVRKFPWRNDRLPTLVFLGFPSGSDGKKNPPAMQETWVGKIPWRRAWQPIPVFLPGELLWTEEPGELQSMGSQRVGQD